MIFEGLTLAEYLAPRMKLEKKEKTKRITKRNLIEQSYKNGDKVIVCALAADCEIRWARRVIKEIKKAAVS